MQGWGLLSGFGAARAGGGRREGARELCEGIWGRLGGLDVAARPSGGSVTAFGTLSVDGEALWDCTALLRGDLGIGGSYVEIWDFP